MFQCCNDYSDCLKLLHFFLTLLFRFRYRFRPKEKLFFGFGIGFGRKEKWLFRLVSVLAEIKKTPFFGRTLTLVYTTFVIQYVPIYFFQQKYLTIIYHEIFTRKDDLQSFSSVKLHWYINEGCTF